MDKSIFGFQKSDSWNHENAFYLTSDIRRIAKLLAHYEIYKMITDLPGNVVECGVYKGASLLRFATFREVLESPYSRTIIGFDAFGEFPKPDSEQDRAFVARFESEGGQGISLEEMSKALQHKSIRNVELIKGDIADTVPQYVTEHPELRIALLHIDVDVYDPTRIILEQLYHRVVRGGIVVFDDFGMVAGETRAIEEFFGSNGPTLGKLPISHVPAYVKKDH